MSTSSDDQSLQKATEQHFSTLGLFNQSQQSALGHLHFKLAEARDPKLAQQLMGKSSAQTEPSKPKKPSQPASSAGSYGDRRSRTSGSQTWSQWLRLETLHGAASLNRRPDIAAIEMFWSGIDERARHEQYRPSSEDLSLFKSPEQTSTYGWTATRRKPKQTLTAQEVLTAMMQQESQSAQFRYHR